MRSLTTVLDYVGRNNVPSFFKSTMFSYLGHFRADNGSRNRSEDLWSNKEIRKQKCFNPEERKIGIR